MKRDKHVLQSIAMALALSATAGCLEPYTPPPGQANANYLVVEGYLDTDNEATTIKLSRTSPLSDDNIVTTESLASVTIEQQDGATYSLPETSVAGTYESHLTVDPVGKYRLVIVTAAGTRYASDFVPFKRVPPIDSISWGLDGNAVDIHANAHDPTGNTHYYLWKCVETWQYHSRYWSVIKFENHQVVRRDEEIYTCWTTQPSPQIQIASTTQLSNDIISQHVLRSIPLSSIKFQTQYSILVHQYALTREGFDYWQQVKKNTEEIGTIFGPQPSQVPSNIHCVTNPLEPVVGFFSASTVETQRIHILHDELPVTPEITGYETCEADTLPLSSVPDIHGTPVLITEAYKGIALVGYLESSIECVDCRVRGGVTVKPPYWK